MSSFDDREKGFEAKFARDQDSEFRVSARRNRLLGEWAGRLMGLEDENLDNYAKAVVKSDFEQPGDEDVFRKVFGDVSGAGLSTSEGEVRRKMDELMAEAREQIRTAG